MMALAESIDAHELRDEYEQRCERDGLPRCEQPRITKHGSFVCTRPHEHDGVHVACTYVTPLESFARYGEPVEIYVIAAVWPR